MADRKFQWKIHCVLWLAATGLAVGAQPTPPPAAAPATAAAAAAPAGAPAKSTPSMGEILAAAPASAWRPLVDEHTIYMQLPAGRVVIELEPAMAPHTVAAIESFVRMRYFEGALVVRAQDNYVAQWSVPGDKPDESRKVPDNMRTLAPEFTVPASAATFTVLPDRDGFAPEAGFVDSFPAARDPAAGLMWLAHCYGAVGVGRDNAADSGNGSELYAVIGHAPRHLDRNVTVVGRVRAGIELLSSLPRGTGSLGMYENPALKLPISSVRMASDVPAAERTRLEVLRTDTPTFAAVVEARRNRHDDWYLRPAGYIDLCNAPIPVRPMR
jgi:cyclophilin family peptidyl-prolyl cis-trans isomerase